MAPEDQEFAGMSEEEYYRGMAESTYEQLPVDEFFALSRAAYLVIPRLAIQEMSEEWQRRLFSLVESMAEQLGPDVLGKTYDIQRLDDDDKPMVDPRADYRHGRIFKRDQGA